MVLLNLVVVNLVVLLDPEVGFVAIDLMPVPVPVVPVVVVVVVVVQVLDLRVDLLHIVLT